MITKYALSGSLSPRSLSSSRKMCRTWAVPGWRIRWISFRDRITVNLKCIEPGALVGLSGAKAVWGSRPVFAIPILCVGGGVFERLARVNIVLSSFVLRIRSRRLTVRLPSRSRLWVHARHLQAATRLDGLMGLFVCLQPRYSPECLCHHTRSKYGQQSEPETADASRGW